MDRHGYVRCLENSQCTHEATILRRSANYHPDIWGDDFVQSIKSDYTGDNWTTRAQKLKEDVRKMLNAEEMGSLAQLELIDNLRRLGVEYHFEKETKTIIDTLAINTTKNHVNGEDLHFIAQYFRLLRQHGHKISQDVFNGFKDEMGNFKKSVSNYKDLQGMLSLYEASHLAGEGENVLSEAENFTTRYLKEINSTSIDPNLYKQVSHSLEIPLHQRMLRLEARWCIDEYEKKKDVNVKLLELAKLDFNMVQQIHQKDLKDMSRWWRELGLATKLNFSRDRLMESFLWTVGVIFEPQYRNCRKGLTKVFALVTTIDDVYDVYGSLDELELFTDAIARWDINAIEQLSNYMKTCFLALYNTVNEIAYDTLKEQDWNILPYLKEAWANLCKAYLIEAKWYYKKYKSTLEEYLNNAWISVGGPLILVHAYFLLHPNIKDDEPCIERYQNLIRLSSLISRLCDDLETSTAELERGDVPKAIQCYMFETGLSEEVAREHIKQLISDTWKKMNKEIVMGSPFLKTFTGLALNAARMSQCMYQYGDGHGVQHGETRIEFYHSWSTPSNSCLYNC